MDLTHWAAELTRPAVLLIFATLLQGDCVDCEKISREKS
jgi:hypothetical protein